METIDQLKNEITRLRAANNGLASALGTCEAALANCQSALHRSKNFDMTGSTMQINQQAWDKACSVLAAHEAAKGAT